MDNQEKEAELYAAYQQEMRNIESQREDCQCRKRELQEQADEYRSVLAEEQDGMDQLAAQWGEGEDIGVLRRLFGEFRVKQEQELRQKEDTLKEELKNLSCQQEQCETHYRTAKQKLMEEEEME